MRQQWTIRACVAVLALCMPLAHAQAQPAQGSGTNGPVAPVGPIRQGAGSNAGRQLPLPAARGISLEPSSMDSSEVRADTRTLSSIETLGIGTLGALTSFVDPSFRFNQSGDTGVVPGVRASATSLGMNLAFDRYWSRAHLTGLYSGAQVMYYPDSSFNTAYHDLGVAQEITLSRWVFRLRDDLLIAPDAPFGGLDIGSTGISGGAHSLHGLQPTAAADDAILTQRAKRLANTASGEVNYSLSRRSVVTLAGSYTSLNFTEPGFIESHGINGRVGYDYLVTPRDTIALMYVYDRTDFSEPHDRLRTDSFQFSYGRKVAGRLAFQIAAGPQLLRSTLQGRNLTWTVTSNMNYQTRRNQYVLSYARIASRGSGVFLGADRHTVVASFQRALTPTWTSLLTTGYAYSHNLAEVDGVINQFNDWYGSAAVGRAFGRHLRLDFKYGFQRQVAGAGLCPVLACGLTQSRQTLGITLEWHPWSIVAR